MVGGSNPSKPAGDPSGASRPPAREDPEGNAVRRTGMQGSLMEINVAGRAVQAALSFKMEW